MNLFTLSNVSEIKSMLTLFDFVKDSTITELMPGKILIEVTVDEASYIANILTEYERYQFKNFVENRLPIGVEAKFMIYYV